MEAYDDYEISPCRRLEEPDRPGHHDYEVCEEHEADVWTLYGRLEGQGVEAIGDFATRQYAEEVFEKITGLVFVHSREVAVRLRLRRAAPALLDAIRAILPYAEAELASLGSCLGRDGHDILPELNHCESAVDRARSLIDQAAQGEQGRPDPAKKRLPADPEATNDKRAKWASSALATFQQVTGTDEEDALGDLLGDLMHWADRNDFDFDAAFDRARWHYAAETAQEAV